QALFLAKGAPFRSARDQFVAALDETALNLIGGGRPEQLFDMILERATRLLGVSYGYVYLADPGETQLTAVAGVGRAVDWVGFKLQIDRGLGGRVFRTGQPFAIEDYGSWDEAAPEFVELIGAAVGVPLTVGGKVVGVLGLSAAPSERVFRQAEIDALSRFGQLASIALENARLQEQALALRDSVTGL